jgi:hypothetical protein
MTLALLVAILLAPVPMHVVLIVRVTRLERRASFIEEDRIDRLEDVNDHETRIRAIEKKASAEP